MYILYSRTSLYKNVNEARLFMFVQGNMAFKLILSTEATLEQQVSEGSSTESTH